MRLIYCEQLENWSDNFLDKHRKCRSRNCSGKQQCCAWGCDLTFGIHFSSLKNYTGIWIPYWRYYINTNSAKKNMGKFESIPGWRNTPHSGIAVSGKAAKRYPKSTLFNSAKRHNTCFYLTPQAFTLFSCAGYTVDVAGMALLIFWENHINKHQDNTHTNGAVRNIKRGPVIGAGVKI